MWNLNFCSLDIAIEYINKVIQYFPFMITFRKSTGSHLYNFDSKAMLIQLDQH